MRGAPNCSNLQICCCRSQNLTFYYVCFLKSILLIDLIEFGMFILFLFFCLQRTPVSHKVIEKRRRDRINRCLNELGKTVPMALAKQVFWTLESIFSVKYDTFLYYYITFSQSHLNTMRRLEQILWWFVLLVELWKTGEGRNTGNDCSVSPCAALCGFPPREREGWVHRCNFTQSLRSSAWGKWAVNSSSLIRF